MPWVKTDDRLPDATGEYKVIRKTSASREIEDTVFFEIGKGRQRIKSWYSMTTGGKLYHVQSWWENS